MTDAVYITGLRERQTCGRDGTLATAHAGTPEPSE
jgi:hypothetical protein